MTRPTRTVTGVSVDRRGRLWSRVRYPDGVEQEEPVTDHLVATALYAAREPETVVGDLLDDLRDGAGGLWATVQEKASGLIDTVTSEPKAALEGWQAEWSRNARSYIDRLNRLALKWQAVANAAKTPGERSAYESRRANALRVRDWVYEVADTYFGGIDKMPISGAVGAFQAAAVPVIKFAVAGAVGGAITLTAGKLAGWLDAEEADVENARTEQLRTLVPMTQSSDPNVRRAGADAINQLATAFANNPVVGGFGAMVRKWGPRLAGAAAVGVAGYGAYKVARGGR